jgi:hypothetical protein
VNSPAEPDVERETEPEAERETEGRAERNDSGDCDGTGVCAGAEFGVFLGGTTKESSATQRAAITTSGRLN